MASRHLKTTIFISKQLQFPKLQLLRCQNFLKDFLPFRSVGFCLRAWSWGPGSRGDTPLHKAAFYGHVVVVQRLLEAKAAVDAQNNNGRGLGGGFGGETLLRQSLREEVDETLMVQVVGVYIYIILIFFCFSPTAIALGYSAIVKVSGQNCFWTLYGSLGQIHLGLPNGSAEGSTEVPLRLHQGSSKGAPRFHQGSSSFMVFPVFGGRSVLGCQKVLWKVPPSLL